MKVYASILAVAVCTGYVSAEAQASRCTKDEIHEINDTNNVDKQPASACSLRLDEQDLSSLPSSRLCTVNECVDWLKVASKLPDCVYDGVNYGSSYAYKLSDCIDVPSGSRDASESAASAGLIDSSEDGSEVNSSDSKAEASAGSDVASDADSISASSSLTGTASGSDDDSGSEPEVGDDSGSSTFSIDPLPTASSSGSDSESESATSSDSKASGSDAASMQSVAMTMTCVAMAAAVYLA